MTNPVSVIPGAQIPPITEKLVDSNGAATTNFYRFFNGLYLRTGGAAGVSAGNAAQVANQAITVANQANTQAQHALTEAQQALSETANLEAEVQAAVRLATAAGVGVGNSQATALQRVNNLNDLFDPRTARINLGLGQVPCLFQFDTLPASLKRGVPIIYTGRVEANLASTLVWWSIAPTSTAVFTVSYVRAGVINSFASITILSGGAGVTLSSQPAVALQYGDTLVVQAPTVADATLAQMAITIPLFL